MSTDLTTTYGDLPRAVFAERPAPHLSSRYVHIDTREVVSLMEQEGYVLDGARGVRHRTRDPLFGKHQLYFVHPDIPRIEGGVPRVLFNNSHDGSTRATFRLGLYRFVCGNGLVVGTDYAHAAARHAGEAAQQLIERVRALSRNTAPMFAQIEAWSRRELTVSEEQEFARLAAVLRWGDVQRFAPEQLLDVRREEDAGRSLWRVFNRVQENATHGSLVGYSAQGRQLSSRPLVGIDADTSFNSQLWQLASEFAG